MRFDEGLVGLVAERAAPVMLASAPEHPRFKYFPEADEDEYYWRDLIGMAVSDLQGSRLGSVKELLETGANDVLVVSLESGGEELIPFVAQVVQSVDTQKRQITVDWLLE